MSGKTLRLKRFQPAPDGRIVILPLDHGVTCGPISGVSRIGNTIQTGIRAGVNALVLHKGMMRYLEGFSEALPGIFMHLSASTLLGPDCHHKVLVGTVEEAICRGADGVSIHINLGDCREPDMLKDLGALGAACACWQMPLLVMVYVRGTHAPAPVPDAAIAHAARVAAELGADIIKIPAPQDVEVLAEISDGLPVPVVIAGGSRTSDVRSFLHRLERALQAGVKGVAFGRNIFQHEHPARFLKAICDIVHGSVSAEKAWEALSGEASGNS